MIKKIFTTVLRQPNTVSYAFSGGAHHEIDYHAVVTKNVKSGIQLLMYRLLYQPQLSRSKDQQSHGLLRWYQEC